MLLGIPVIGVVVASLLPAAVAAARRRGASLGPKAPLIVGTGFAAWLGFWSLAGTSGLLAQFDQRPPPLMVTMALTLALSVYVATSRLGGELSRVLPLTALVGFQSFRLPLELVMHRAATEGVMPSVMSYSGYNFDIVTGATALLLGLWLHFGNPPLWLVAAWNALGFALLVAIGAIAIAATPVFAAFGDGQLNVWVTQFPFVALPGSLVPSALIGHILVLRRLLFEYRTRSQPSPVAA